MKKHKTLFSIVFFVILALVVAGCQSTGSSSRTVRSITVTGAQGATTVEDGQNLQFGAVILPETAAGKGVSWSVTPGTGKADISQNGLLTATDPGTVTVKATANEGSGVEGTLGITITPATPRVRVGIMEIPGVTVPVSRVTPKTAIDATNQYTGTVTWTPDDNPFIGGKAYTATIALDAKPGYTFDGVSRNAFRVAGATSTTNAANSGIVTAVFPTTQALPDLVINIAQIPGVSVPVRNGTQTTAITATDQYTGSVAWTPNDNPFAGGKAYTATITLYPKAGYTLNGVSRNSFQVAGAASTANAANSGIVTAVFPATATRDIAINNLTVYGVTVPVKGATAKTAIDATDQYTGTVTWAPNDNPFIGGKAYTATIALDPKPGYTFDGVSRNAFRVAGATSTTNAANSGIVTAVFPATQALPDAVISIAQIPGVTIPARGGTPVSVIRETDQYTGTVAWNTRDNPFEASTAYTATITLKAKPGYTLNGVSRNSFQVEGATSTTNAANSGIVTAVFPRTAEPSDLVINIAQVPGVSVPVNGGIPVTTTIATDQYTGTVRWNPTDSPFRLGKVYTATITLKAKPGYTLNGVSENSFTVEGADATNYANSGVVKAVFPSTPYGDVVINIAAIPGVTIPLRGVVPVTAIKATDQYTGTVTWTPNDNPFKAERTYTATITLNPKPGYTLNGVSRNLFTVAGATATNAAGSGVVTAVFPATVDEDTVISTAVIPGVAIPVRTGTPVSVIRETDQYTGTVSWNPNHSMFSGGTQYTATITLKAKPGYTLNGVSRNSFQVAGATSTTNTANSGVVTAVFPSTPTRDVVVNITSIPGVTVPAPGGTSKTAIDATDQYTGTVSWSPDHATFARGTQYTATITLTAKPGYTLNGVSMNSFQVNGAASTMNAANSGVVTVVFPTTMR